MKKFFYGWMVSMAAAALFFPESVFADDPKARAIMQKVDDRDDGDNMTSDMLMILIDKNGDTRKKYFRNFSKDYGKDTKTIMFITKPPNIKNTAFLTFDYDLSEKDDDQWLFLPALGKTKRIASSDKSGSFMGSDLNYSDMTDRELSDYDFKLLKEMKLGGKKVWLIESIPRTEDVIDETGYKKSILAVRQDNYVVVRSKLWTDSGGYIKIMDVKNLEKIDGIWVSTEIHVIKRLGKKTVHQTLLTLSDIKFNQNLGDDLFTIRRLEKGL
jgi:hypothetical protein